MKTVPSNAQTLLDRKHATEPILLVEIQWGTGTKIYSTKVIPGCKSKILDISDLSFTALENTTTSECSVTLDDTDAELKNIIDTTDIHKLQANVYLYFTELNDLNDKFQIFSGKINTPFSWNERDRTIQFTIDSTIEAFEVGFSPEEGQLPFVIDEYIGQAWPLCFGTPVHVPAQRVSNKLSGTLIETLCFLDPTLKYSLQNALDAYNESLFLLRYYKMMVESIAKAAGTQATELLQKYVAIIKTIRGQQQTLSTLVEIINDGKAKLAKDPTLPRALHDQLIKQLDAYGKQLDKNFTTKDGYETKTTQLLGFFADRMEATKKAIAEKTNNAKILQQFINIQQEICRQLRCQTTTFTVKDGEKFPRGVIEIYINGLRYRGSFNHDVFTVIAGPLAKYENVFVDTWMPDPDFCQSEDQSDGAAIFYLRDDQDLTGMFCLVRNRYTGGHNVIKIDSQTGKKVVFNLNSIDFDTSNDATKSISEAIGELKDIPLIPTKFGMIPQQFFDIPGGDWSRTNIGGYATPQGKEILAIINSIFGGVNQHDFEYIARLVYLKVYDKVTADIIQPYLHAREVYTCIGEDISHVVEASPVALEHWWKKNIPFEDRPSNFAWKADAGSTVREGTDDCAIYVCNILPSTIKAVHAYRTFSSGKRILVPVPSSYYEKYENYNLGSINVTLLVFKVAIENIPGLDFEPDIYVTMESSVGPKTTDILKHIIETYTDADWDSTSFDEVEALLDDKYPMNFALLSRPNAITELNRIAWEARCGLYLYNNTFYLKYLSKEPDSEMDLSSSFVDADNSLTVSFPTSDALVTRMVNEYDVNYLPKDKPLKYVIRQNVNKYGLISVNEYFHCFNHKDLVIKTATFWLTRRANTWKQVSFNSWINTLPLDVFDGVTFLELPKPYFNTPADQLCVLKSITYSLSTNRVSITLETPIKSGEMLPYKWYWPALQGQNDQFPPGIEVERGFFGSGPGSGVTGDIDVC